MKFPSKQSIAQAIRQLRPTIETDELITIIGGANVENLAKGKSGFSKRSYVSDLNRTPWEDRDDSQRKISLAIAQRLLDRGGSLETVVLSFFTNKKK